MNDLNYRQNDGFHTKVFQNSVNSKNVQVNVCENVGRWSRDSEMTRDSFILKVLLRLVQCQMNALYYQQNDRFLEICSRVWSMLKGYRERFLSIFDTGHVTQKL